jgi:protease-4
MIDTLTQIPGHYGGVMVPHWDQYRGVYAMPVDCFDSIMATVRATDPQGHVAETSEKREERIAAGGATRTWRDDAELDAHGYQIVGDGVAVVDLNGPMTKYGGSFSSMQGGMVGLRRTLRAAAADGAVGSILLRVDSPGGSVAGTDDTADDLRRINRVKPVVAFLEDVAASGAYYVASSAGMIIAAKGAEVGSIGVYMVVDDWSALFAREGVKRYVIRSGAMKGAGVPGTEITAEQLADFQRNVDEIHALFVASVAAGRKMSVETVEKLADGRIHIASQAKMLGLVDEIGTFDDAVAVASRIAKATLSKSGTNGNPARVAEARIAPQAHREKEIDAMSSTTEVDAVVKAGGSRPATLAELKKALPDATAEFRESCMEMDATIQDATELWMDKLRDQNKALAAEVAMAKAASKKPGVEPVASGAAPSADAGDENALIEQSVKDAGGNYRKGLETLQRKLIQPFAAAGLSNRVAHERAAQRYPTVFGQQLE